MDRPELSGVQLLDAYRALVPFLTYHRDQLLKAEIRNIEKLKIVDTVLLKTYMHASYGQKNSVIFFPNFYDLKKPLNGRLVTPREGQFLHLFRM